MPLFTTSTTIGRSSCTAVASSCPVMRKSPSPGDADHGCAPGARPSPRRRPGRRSPSSRCAARAGSRSGGTRSSGAPRSMKLPAPFVRIASGPSRSRSAAMTADICSVAGELGDLVQVALVLGVGRLEQPLPRGRRRELRRRGRERLEIAGDAELRLVDGPRAGPGRDARGRAAGAGAGGVEEGVGVGRDLAQAPADRQQHVGVADPRRERRVHPEPRVPGVGGRAVVDVVLAAEGGGDGDALRLAERRDVEAGPGRPAALADDRQRALCTLEQLRQARHRRIARRRGGERPVRCRVGDVDDVGEHVLGQRENDGARSP